MTKRLTCIECPQSCALTAEIDDRRAIRVSGHKCPKGEEYAKTEIENPLRVLTATVLAKGVPRAMVPVRTDKPIPKARVLEAAAEVRKLRVARPVRIGDVIVPNFLGLGVDLIATRDV